MNDKTLAKIKCIDVGSLNNSFIFLVIYYIVEYLFSIIYIRTTNVILSIKHGSFCKGIRIRL